jgi:GTP pyrophosphokinase
MDKWLSSVRYVLEHPDASRPEDLPQPSSREIFVFTPSGELRILPAGASVLDFAFNIHSNLGISCCGGKVNGKAVSIKEKLETGDVVEIMRSKNQKPSQDWLNCVVSSKARAKIKQALNEDEIRKASIGKELLDRRLKNWKLDFPDEEMAELMKKLRYSTVNSFFAAVGDESLDINVIKNFILEQDDRAQESVEAAKALEAANEISLEQWEKKPKGEANDDILVINAAEMKGLDYKMARCCHPVYGDDVFGFVTRTDGIKIHRMSCPNAARLIEMYPYRIQKVKWSNVPSSNSFQTTLRFTTVADSVVINQIINIANQFKASVRSFNVSEDQHNATYDISMKIAIPSNMELDKVISQAKLLKSVLKISRQ